jgi:hypothetical protein
MYRLQLILSESFVFHKKRLVKFIRFSMLSL